MRQSAPVLLGHTVVQIDLPNAESDVLPGLPWGAIEAFPTPAYWAYQVMARRVTSGPAKHRLGETLAQEVAACLLGGHGIPANVGLAAFQRLKSLGVLHSTPSEADLFSLLSEPLQVNDRRIKYRFARQKASYLSSALARLASGSPPLDSGKSLRNWLLRSPGIGLKTASWIARNWLTANDVAILDIHVLRAGALGGFFDESLTVERNYLELESQFLRFSQADGAWPSELDAVLWFEMTNSPLSVSELMGGRRSRVRPSVPDTASSGASSALRAGKSYTDPHQANLIE